MKFAAYRQFLLTAVVSLPIIGTAASVSVSDAVVDATQEVAPLGPGALPVPTVPTQLENSDFGIILKRPLFDPSRRPPPAVVSTAVPTQKRGATTPPDIKLLGVVTADGLKTAIIKTGKGGRVKGDGSG